MQTQHKRFLDSIEWNGYFGTDGRLVKGDDKDLDSMLEELDRKTRGILEEYEDRQQFTPPSRERREAKQKAEHRIQKETLHRTRGSS